MTVDFQRVQDRILWDHARMQCSNSTHMWHADVLLDREVDFIPYLPRRDILRQPSTRLEEDLLIASLCMKTQPPPQQRPCRPPKGRREEREERPPPPMPWRSAAALRAAANALDATHGPLCRWCCTSCSYCNSIFHRDCMLCRTPRDAAMSLVTCLCIPSSPAARAGSIPSAVETFLTGHALSSSGISDRLQRLTAVTLPHLIGTASSLEVASATLSVLLAAIRRALNAPKTACVLSSAEVAAVLHAPGGGSLLEDLGFVDDDGGVVARPPCRSAQDVSLLRALGSLLARSQPTPTEQALGRRELLRSLRRVDPRDRPRDREAASALETTFWTKFDASSAERPKSGEGLPTAAAPGTSISLEGVAAYMVMLDDPNGYPPQRPSLPCGPQPPLGVTSASPQPHTQPLPTQPLPTQPLPTATPLSHSPPPASPLLPIQQGAQAVGQGLQAVGGSLGHGMGALFGIGGNQTLPPRPPPPAGPVPPQRPTPPAGPPPPRPVPPVCPPWGLPAPLPTVGPVPSAGPPSQAVEWAD